MRSPPPPTFGIRTSFRCSIREKQAGIEGETLRDRLTRDGALPIADALRVADEVGGALSYAHGRGVTHRDNKPENVLIEAAMPSSIASVAMIAFRGHHC